MGEGCVAVTEKQTPKRSSHPRDIVASQEDRRGQIDQKQSCRGAVIHTASFVLFVLFASFFSPARALNPRTPSCPPTYGAPIPALDLHVSLIGSRSPNARHVAFTREHFGSVFGRHPRSLQLDARRTLKKKNERRLSRDLNAD